MGNDKGDPQDIFVANTTGFVGDGRGGEFHIIKDVTRVRRGSDVFQRAPGLFNPITVDFEVPVRGRRVETATANPGAQRGTEQATANPGEQREQTGEQTDESGDEASDDSTGIVGAPTGDSVSAAVETATAEPVVSSKPERVKRTGPRLSRRARGRA